jgi:acyl-CoA synthetase (AMP-forming)/AMP-acid ligase II
MNLMMLLEMAASGFGDRVAIQSGDRRLSYDELFAAAGRAGARITEAGVAHAALLDVSSLAVPIGLFGSACAGVPFVPLNYRLTGRELDALIEQIAPALLIAEDARVEELSGREGIHVVSRSEFLADTTRAGHPPGEWPMEGDEIAILLFTSGTTGAPKAAVLRHTHLVSYILGSVEYGASDASQAGLVSVPPYHVAGMAAILSAVYSGRRIVQLPSFDAAEWLRLAEREAVTNAFVVPTMLSRIIDELESGARPSLPALRAISYGGGKMPLAVIERAMRHFPDTGFTNAYGLTETSSTISVLGPEEHREAISSDREEVRRRLTSVGRPLPSVEVEIHDEDGKPVPAGVRGEIVVRGEQVSGEYLGRRSQLRGDGWFPTRDGGYLDADGFLYVDARIDDVIVRGGENLSPGEIEDVLLAHEDVRDCAVVGVPDEQWGEAVAAAVVLEPGARCDAAALRQWVKERMRSSRTPERIEFRDALPYNETGKLLRRVIRAELSDGRATPRGRRGPFRRTRSWSVCARPWPSRRSRR